MLDGDETWNALGSTEDRPVGAAHSAPAEDRAIAGARARAPVAGGDLDDVAQTRHARGDIPADMLPIAELALSVRAPAPDGPIVEDGAAMVVADSEVRHALQVRYRRRRTCRRARWRSTTELSCKVEPPAMRGAVAQASATMGLPDGDFRDIGQARHGPGLSAERASRWPCTVTQHAMRIATPAACGAIAQRRTRMVVTHGDAGGIPEILNRPRRRDAALIADITELPASAFSPAPYSTITHQCAGMVIGGHLHRDSFVLREPREDRPLAFVCCTVTEVAGRVVSPAPYSVVIEDRTAIAIPTIDVQGAEPARALVHHLHVCGAGR